MLCAQQGRIADQQPSNSQFTPNFTTFIVGSEFIVAVASPDRLAFTVRVSLSLPKPMWLYSETEGKAWPSRNKPRSGLVALGEPIERGHEQAYVHCGTHLRRIARRGTTGDAKRSSAIVDSSRRDGIDASADDGRVLHRGNDGELLQRRRWPEHRRLWRKKQFRIG